MPITAASYNRKNNDISAAIDKIIKIILTRFMGAPLFRPVFFIGLELIIAVQK